MVSPDLAAPPLGALAPATSIASPVSLLLFPFPRLRFLLFFVLLFPLTTAWLGVSDKTSAAATETFAAAVVDLSPPPSDAAADCDDMLALASSFALQEDQDNCMHQTCSLSPFDERNGR